ncbi:MAG: HAMP domain-containing histidine kinase [Clostridia bacterium]|nr:HAMP domain-containing histidine kinase [Clostridia bacterium]
MRFAGITKRWFLNIASVVVLILITVSFALLLSLRGYYYSVADMALDSYSAEELSSSFALYGDAATDGFRNAGRNFVESFPDKDSMAVWIIDNSGNVMLSSSGFEIKGKVTMPDYEEAMKGTNNAKWTGRLPSGEKIIAKTCVYNYPDGSHAGAVRFMISLEQIENQLVRLTITVSIVAIALFALLMISGSIFIRSIVNPVKAVGDTAKKIAGGDLEARIDHYSYDDEIGELCKTINDMATKLSVTDRLKNDFISTVSHELRTPLTAIKGWGETLLQIGDTDPAMTQRGMSVIISEASRLNEMVEELLDFSRMSSGRMKLNFEKIDILAELDEVLFSFRERTAKEGIEIVYNVPHVPAPATADASRMRQVFINILDNALKYSKSGGRIIVIADMPNPATLVVTVSDTGIGISAEDLPHVKEKFYKVDSTVRGSGIGLAVVDEIIRLHKGELEISSLLGEGTTVKITLPLEPVTFADSRAESEGDTASDE